MRPIPGLVLLVSLAACCGSTSDAPPPPPYVRIEYRPVSILVEVYDPVTNLVWPGAAVRIVEADQEWSQCTCSNAYSDAYLTDNDGLVLLDEWRIGDAGVGFQEDDYGAALLGSRWFEDQATVVLEVDLGGLYVAYFTVPLSFDQPDVYVQLPM